MPFDDKVWDKPAVGGTVGGVAIDAAAAFYAIHSALKKLAESNNVDIAADLDEIMKVSDGLHETFETLSGWIDNADA